MDSCYVEYAGSSISGKPESTIAIRSVFIVVSDVDEGVMQMCLFNLHLYRKRLLQTLQDTGLLPESVWVNI